MTANGDRPGEVNAEATENPLNEADAHHTPMGYDMGTIDGPPWGMCSTRIAPII